MKRNLVSRRFGPFGLIALAVSVALIAAACSSGEEGAGQAEETYVANASDYASKAATDWSKAETVRVELGEFYFKSDNLTFKTGKPYKVELVNVGDQKHEFTAGRFFASVAWRKAESSESEVKVPFFTEIEVFAGKQVDLYFVPVTPGTYELVCEIEGHLEAGMHGTITVTGSTPTDPAPVYESIASGPWVPNGAELVSAADWGTMEEIEIELGEFFFKPSDIQLREGQPYKLILHNYGNVKHESTAPEFFKTVAFRKAEDASGEFKAPAPLEVETFADKETELFLIPTKVGTYELVCEIEGHLEAGMHGTITVTAR